jgi:hypothetical protein
VEARDSFHCSDETLNKIWEVGAYTVRLCMLDTYVDCPAYKQVYWVGDARNSALVNAVAFGAHDLTERCAPHRPVAFTGTEDDYPAAHPGDANAYRHIARGQRMV